MNHIKLRRIAISAASVSFGSLMAVVLLWSSAFQSSAGADPGDSSQQIIVSQEEDALPIPISCTPLVVEKLSAYDGSFLEDGSGQEVMDVAAILLHNNSTSVIPYAYVTVYTQSCRYKFDAFMIPPESSVLVPDADGKKLQDTSVVRVFGWITVNNQSKAIHLEMWEKGNDGLWVQNVSGQKLRGVTLYHRTYIAEGGFYLGGKAFATLLPELPPGGKVLVFPKNYARGSSRVVYCE